MKIRNQSIQSKNLSVIKNTENVHCKYTNKSKRTFGKKMLYKKVKEVMVDKHMLVSKTKKLNSRCKILKDFENKYNAQENRKKYSYNRKQQ